MKEHFKVHKNKLLLIAGFIWTIVGVNIIRIGIIAYTSYINVLNIILSIIICLTFQFLIFNKMVIKHTQRIIAYKEDQQLIVHFFDVKSYCIMAFMMTFGIGLRVSGICPDVFIAVFYSGLGSSLLIAGLLFIINYIKKEKIIE